MPSPVAAGSWLLSQGENQYTSSLSYSTSTAYWDSSGVLHESGQRSHSWSVNQRYEYGYSYYRTLYLSTDLIHKTSGSGSVSGLGDLMLGVRGRLNRYRNGLAWEAGVIVPTGYSRDRRIRLGYGRFGFEVALAMRFLGRAKSHAEVEVKVRHWQGPPADQFRPSLKWVRQLTPNWNGWGEIQGVFSFGNGQLESIPGIDYDRLPEYDVIRVGLGVKHAFRRRWSLGLGLYWNVWGRNAGKSVGGDVSVSRSW